MDTKVDLKVKIIYDKSGDNIFVKDVITSGGSSIYSKLSEHEKEQCVDVVHEYADHGDISDAEMNMEIYDIEVSVDGKFIRGSSDRFDSNFGNWLPGDPEDVEIESINIGDIDVTNSITDYSMNKLREKFMEFSSQQESINGYNKKIDKLTDRLDQKLRRGKVKSKLIGKDSKIPGFSYYFQKK